MVRDDVALLGALARALEAHELTAFTQRAASALAARLPVSWVEVSLRAGGAGQLSSALVIGAAAVATVSARVVGQALLSSVRAPAVLPLPGPPEWAALPELVRARSTGASRLLFVPARQRDECIGQLVAAIADPHVGIDVQTLDAMAAVLSAGLGNLDLVARLARLSRRAHRENRHLREDLQHATAPVRLTGSSPPFRQAVAAADAVAPYTTPVLLRGESGTGKELLALHIHERSTRAHRPFLKLNCGAIPEGLVEAELFGHERGAFTGAIRRHEGIFERASGGTVLLDEVAELPLASQVKILRVLQSGEYHRVGGREARHADARVIAATHRDLEGMIASGGFRTDLFFRLNVFPIVLPPLRERREDISLVASALLQRLAIRLGRPSALTLDRDALARLEAYPWPGNVRELENVLERALILSPGPTLMIPELPGGLGAGGRIRSAPREESLAAATRRHIEAALRACGGKIYGRDGAAARLDLPPTTLQSKMLRLGISGSSGIGAGRPR
jgi:transcriptional regulator with GAF, ATPase, and Fis domain